MIIFPSIDGDARLPRHSPSSQSVICVTTYQPRSAEAVNSSEMPKLMPTSHLKVSHYCSVLTLYQESLLNNLRNLPVPERHLLLKRAAKPVH